jgi:hypothetical protein
MKRFAFNLLMLTIMGLLVYGGYFSLKSLTDPKKYVPVDTEKIGDLHHIVSSADNGLPTRVLSSTATAVTSASSTTNQTSSTNNSGSSDLSTQIKSMIDQKITLKSGSKGSTVGSMQQFMNLYFQKQSKIDNDYGKRLVADVIKFQGQNKISQTGKVGAQTLQRMIEWLNKNTPT